MIKIAVCDDEKNIRSYLASLIREQGVECEITAYASADEYLSGGMEHDLLFLDIELNSSAISMDGLEINASAAGMDGLGMNSSASGMDGLGSNGSAAGMDGLGSNGSAAGMDGLGLARHIRDMEQMKQPVIVFVTGHEKYVYDAFDVDAFQYLVKPVNEQKFAEVFSRAQDKILSKAEQKKKMLVIQHAGASKAIPLDNIYYMESQGHKVLLYTKDGKLEYYAKIGALEKDLWGYFCRIHKGYLVNFAHVDGYSRTEAFLANGDKLPLSKYKYKDFVKAYLHFMQQEG